MEFGQVHSRGWSQAWLEAWLEAWPRAKTAAEADVLWRRGAETEAEVAWVAWVEPEALGLAAAWEEARVRAPGDPALVNLSTIRDTLTSHHRYGIAHRLWHRSPKSRDEYSSIIHFIAPIHRLPFELLRQIFLTILDEASSPPSVLMLVCKNWHTVVTTLWGSLYLGTRTSIDAVTSTLERNQWLLDIVVDTDSDRGDFTPSDDAFKAIFAAIKVSSRWRSLVVKSFPAQADVPEELVNRHLQQGLNATMSRFTTFKIKSACETSPLRDGLLHILGSTACSELTTVEINSASVVSFLAPAYSSIFSSVKVLTLDTPGIANPVDLLPHLYQLETFTASHLSLPTYQDHVNLPFVHTLRHLSLRAVSIQWMSGRTFHVLERCTLTFPLPRHVLHPFCTTFPNCTHLTFQGYPLEILGGVLAHKLDHLSIICSNSFNRRGSRQLVSFSSQALGERRLTPQCLHISITATNQAWMSALVFMADLKELVIHNARPASPGAKALQSLVVQSGYTSNLGATATPGELGAPLCPSLRRFGLKYDRWLRPSEQFDLIPVFVSIIRSRQHANYSLESFDLWTTSDQKDPLELIEGLHMSVKGFRRLAKESGIEEDSLDSTAIGLIQVTPEPSVSQPVRSDALSDSPPPLDTTLSRPSNQEGAKFGTIIVSPGEEVKLEREVPPAGGTVVEVRRDVCVTLRFDMAKISRRTSIEYAGLKIPLTPSVKRRESTQVHKLLGLRMFVFGTTSGRQYGLICDDCQKKENQPGSPSLVDFRSNSDVILPLRNSDDKSIRISFSFHCYPTHYKNGDSQYRLEVLLCGQEPFIARYRLPYTFNIVAKRTRDLASPAPQAESSRSVGITMPSAGVEDPMDGQNAVIEGTNPGRGPTTGGIEIWIYVSNLPNDSTPLYARFGEHVTRVFIHQSGLLSCTLPPQSGPCTVPVTLSRGHTADSPPLGESLCKFDYYEHLNEAVAILTRVLEGSNQEQAAALELLVKSANIPTREPGEGAEVAREEGLEITTSKGQ